jgi:hypothetical protein
MKPIESLSLLGCLSDTLLGRFESFFLGRLEIEAMHGSAVRTGMTLRATINEHDLELFTALRASDLLSDWEVPFHKNACG